MNDSIYFNFTPNEWLQFYRVFRKYLQKKTPTNGKILV